MNRNAIVIGYGNELYGDDNIGERIANAINSWHLLTVESLAVDQLTPELAANLANADLAIFVDAYIKPEPLDVKVQSLSPTGNITVHENIGDPSSLLDITKSLYGHCPSAWLVTVSGLNCEISDRISPSTENGIAIALIKIMQILNKCRNVWMQIE